MGGFLLKGPAQCSCDNLPPLSFFQTRRQSVTCAARGRTLDWMCAHSSETSLSSTWVFRCDTAPSLLCLSFALLHPITLPSFHLISSALSAPLLSKNNTMVIIILCNKSNTQSRTKATHSNPRCTSYHNNMEFCFIILSCNNVKILHRLIHVCKVLNMHRQHCRFSSLTS